jgi:hypothetical protein
MKYGAIQEVGMGTRDARRSSLCGEATLIYKPDALTGLRRTEKHFQGIGGLTRAAAMRHVTAVGLIGHNLKNDHVWSRWGYDAGSHVS